MWLATDWLGKINHPSKIESGKQGHNVKLKNQKKPKWQLDVIVLVEG